MRRRFNRRRFNPKNRGMEGMPVSHSSNPRRANVVTSRNTNSRNRNRNRTEFINEENRNWRRRVDTEKYCRGYYGWVYTPEFDGNPNSGHPSGWSEIPGQGYIPIQEALNPTDVPFPNDYNQNQTCWYAYQNDNTACNDCWMHTCIYGAVNDPYNMCYIHGAQSPSNIQNVETWWPRQLCQPDGRCDFNQQIINNIPDDLLGAPQLFYQYINHFGYVSGFECLPTGMCNGYNILQREGYAFSLNQIQGAGGLTMYDEQYSNMVFTKEVRDIHCSKDPRCQLDGERCLDLLTHSGAHECDYFNNEFIRHWIEGTCGGSWEHSCSLWGYQEDGEGDNCKVITRLGDKRCVYGRYSCEDDGLITGPGDCGCVTQLSDCDTDDGGENFSPPEICCDLKSFNCAKPDLVFNSAYPENAVEGEDYVCNNNLCKYCSRCTHGGPSFGNVVAGSTSAVNPFSDEFDGGYNLVANSGVGDNTPEHDKTYGSCPERVCCRDFIVRPGHSARTSELGYTGPLTNYIEYLDGEMYIHSCQAANEEGVYAEGGCCGEGGTSEVGAPNHDGLPWGGKACPCDKKRDCAGECSCNRFNMSPDGEFFVWNEDGSISPAPELQYPGHPMHCYTGVCDPVTERGKIQRHLNHVTYCNGGPGGGSAGGQQTYINENGETIPIGTLDAILDPSNDCNKGEEHVMYNGMNTVINYMFNNLPDLYWRSHNFIWGPEYYGYLDWQKQIPFGCGCDSVTALCQEAHYTNDDFGNQIFHNTRDHCVDKNAPDAKRFYVMPRLSDHWDEFGYGSGNCNSHAIGAAKAECENYCEQIHTTNYDHTMMSDRNRRPRALCTQFPTYAGTNQNNEAIVACPIYFSCVNNCRGIGYDNPIDEIIFEY